MGAEVTIPIAISLIALLLADSDGVLFNSLSKKSMQLEDKTKIRLRLKQLGKGSDEDYENFRIAQFSLVAIVTRRIA